MFMESEKILLITSSPHRQGDYINHLPPLGILYLAAYLQQNGFFVDVVDENVSRLDIAALGNYRLIGFSINVANIENSMNLVYRIHSLYPHIPLVIGGPLPTTLPEFFFAWPLEAIFISEAEESLLGYLAGGDSAQALGYYFKNPSTGAWTFKGPAPYIKELDRLPFPALEKVTLERYYTPVKRKVPVSSLISSRGCPFTCTFCSKTLGNKLRARSAENVVKEIEWQTKVLGVREIAIYDDNFTLDAKRAEEICDLLIEKDIKVSLQLTNGVRADTMRRELIFKMKKAGFWMIAFAPESGSEVTLKRLKKGLELKQVEDCVAWCREAGIKSWVFFMVGFPWEDHRMLGQTIRVAKRIRSEITHFSNFTCLPGSELYQEACGRADGWRAQDVNLFSNRGRLGSSRERLPDKRITAKGYAAVYLADPLRMINLFSVLSLKDLFAVIWYAARSRNIF